MPSNPQEPVRFYADETAQLPMTVQRQLREVRAIKAEQLASGGCTDWGAYKDLVGEIRGLDVAIGLCTEAKKELSGE